MIQSIDNSKALFQVGIRAYTPSTLLIPRHLVAYFESRSIFFGSRRLYFRHLIVTYGRFLQHFGIEPNSDKWKKEYQEDGLDLQIRNFKPDPEFWEEFRHIAFAYGLGMCKLFVILLELEQKRWISEGRPENFCENSPIKLKINKHGMSSINNVFFERRIYFRKFTNKQKLHTIGKKYRFFKAEATSNGTDKTGLSMHLNRWPDRCTQIQ